jgi:hypothetical protein
LTLHWGSLKIKELTKLFGLLPVLSYKPTIFSIKKKPGTKRVCDAGRIEELEPEVL